ALLAIALTVGFYALALGLMAAMAFILFQPGVPGRALLFCVIGIVVIGVSIVPWPRRFEPPGPMLNPAGQPRLFAELQAVAQAVGEAMPAEVYVSPEMNAGVLQRGRRRVMVLGLPLMQVLSVNEMRGLLARARGAVAWAAYWSQEVVPLVESGYQPPIAEGFQRFLSEPYIKDAVDKAAEEHLAQARSDPYDSHPPDNQRIAALAAMPDATPEGGASAPASTLVDGIDGIEPFLLIGILRPGLQLRQIRWQDAGTYAMLPGFVDRVRRQGHLLRDYTVGWLPELVGYADRLGQSEASAAGRRLAPDQMRALGVGL